MQAQPASPASPVFGLVIPGGATTGAAVRDIRLANELADRGYAVHVWWAMDWKSGALRPSIGQHWLFHGFRFAGRGLGGLKELAGRALAVTIKDKNRDHVAQKRSFMLRQMWHGLVRRVCAGARTDGRLLRRFAVQLRRTGVTHLMPALEVFCPWAAAARELVPQELKYLVTFQGYEVYGNYAREIGLEQEFYARLRQTVAASDWPAIAVSRDYAERIAEEVGVSRESLVAIPPGVPVAPPMDAQSARELVAAQFESYQPDLPLVSFVGRQDTEKGIDLLLYAARILARHNRPLQLYVCGPTAFGSAYSQVCRQIAEELRLPVEWCKFVPDELRSALFAASRCVVYPSIHREPFGMVPVEAMAQGTPAIVPDHGGVAGVIRAGDGGREEAGLHFRAWDSGDLAAKIELLLDDDALHERLSSAGPGVAEHYSVERLADRVLAHLEIDSAEDGPAVVSFRQQQRVVA
jgi:glycosyltransferase involved in cell wall biosynthesis